MKGLRTCLFLLMCSWASAQLVITEYIEGSGHNKALEIMSTAQDAFDLGASRCQILMYFNGKTAPDLTIDLHGPLQQGEVLVIYHKEQGAEYAPEFERAVANSSKSLYAGFGWFNGNDAIELACSGQTVDSMGQVGNDSNWGKDVTLRRILSTPTADTNLEDAFDPESGWRSFPKDTFEGLGTP